MRQNYHSFKYWDKLVNENKTIRGHMFMDKNPKKDSIYIHSLIFSKKNGIDNIFAYFPSSTVLLGYIQYSFLQEAFYTWINGKDKIVTTVPSLTVEKIVQDGLKKGKINKNEAKLMMTHYEKLESLWSVPKDKILSELTKFCRIFNKTWYGDNQEFLYLKILRNAQELGEFVIDSAMIVGDEEEFKNKIGVDIDEWRLICKDAVTSDSIGERFKTILERNLSEII